MSLAEDKEILRKCVKECPGARAIPQLERVLDALDETERMNEFYKQTIENQAKAVDDYVNLGIRLKEAEKVLEWYAIGENWTCFAVLEKDELVNMAAAPIVLDGGDKAREFLKRLRGQ